MPLPRSTTLSWSHWSFIVALGRNARSLRRARSSQPLRPASDKVQQRTPRGLRYMAQAITAFPKPTAAPTPPSRRNAAGTQHPNAFSIFRWRPARVSGTPIRLDNLDLAADKPLARFQEKPGIPLRLAIASSLSSTSSTCLPDYLTATSATVPRYQLADIRHISRMIRNRWAAGLAHQRQEFTRSVKIPNAHSAIAKVIHSSNVRRYRLSYRQQCPLKDQSASAPSLALLLSFKEAP